MKPIWEQPNTVIRLIRHKWLHHLVSFLLVTQITRLKKSSKGVIYEESLHRRSASTCLHGARLARDMLQRDLLRSMVGSCRARLLHIIHVSGFWGRCSSKKTEATTRDSMCRAAFISSNLNCRPGSQQSRVCRVLRVAVWTLLLYSYVSIFAARLSRRSRAACRVPCKRSFQMPPGLAAVARLLRAACRRVNAPVVFLCFYFAARLSRRSRAACRVPCKRSLIPRDRVRHISEWIRPLFGSKAKLFLCQFDHCESSKSRCKNNFNMSSAVWWSLRFGVSVLRVKRCLIELTIVASWWRVGNYGVPRGAALRPLSFGWSLSYPSYLRTTMANIGPSLWWRWGDAS